MKFEWWKFAWLLWTFLAIDICNLIFSIWHLTLSNCIYESSANCQMANYIDICHVAFSICHLALSTAYVNRHMADAIDICHFLFGICHLVLPSGMCEMPSVKWCWHVPFCVQAMKFDIVKRHLSIANRQMILTFATWHLEYDLKAVSCRLKCNTDAAVS